MASGIQQAGVIGLGEALAAVFAGPAHQRDLLRDEAADGEAAQVGLADPLAARKAMASRAIWAMVSGVAPAEPPTPALSHVTTRRAVATASTSAGCQLSTFA